MFGRPSLAQVSSVAAALAVFLPDKASAKQTGQNLICYNCHEHGERPTVTVTASPATINPGEVTTITIRVSRTNGNRAGFHITTKGVGEFQLVDTVGTHHIAKDDNGEAGVTHSMPRTATSGDITFQVRWKAPAQPGAVDFDVNAVSATGALNAQGMVFPEDDGMGHARLGFAYGCVGKGYWPDLDMDGHGSRDPLGQIWACALRPGLSENADDCNDNNPDVHPKAAEVCNLIDDNCDGKIDEDLPAVTLYPDNDRDGFGVTTGAITGPCGSMFGYAGRAGDCNDNDNKIHPDAKESCNNIDDNCNGRVDEGVLPVCGVGWCARRAASCDPQTCTPGTPRAEVCNGLDDDCNGVTDEGTLCPTGQICIQAECKPDEGGGAAGDGGGAGGDGGKRRSSVSGCAIAGDGSAAGLAAIVMLGVGVALRRRRGHR